MSAPTTRRALMRAGAALPALALLPAAAAGHAHPDADLIAACARHAVNLRTYNNSPSMEVIGEEFEDDPLWIAYCETRDFIIDSRPVTLAGIIAKAQAADAEAGADHQPKQFQSAEEQWAWGVVQDLLRLRGEA